jgi:nicotinic acid mononucleotide adenylyltransferase
VQVCGEGVDSAQGLVALAGSFNPPHVAHLALLGAGVAAAEADAGVFVLSARTVDKESVSGLLLEDRLWLLCRLVADAAGPDGPSRMGVVATNKGLYVDQAEALGRLAPQAGRVVFVTGFDKIVQVFDPRYYADRDRDLDRLFERATFLVAPRDAYTPEDLAALLGRPENRRYAAGVEPLAFDPDLVRVSSTDARAAFAAGAESTGIVPALVERFVRATGCYAGPEGEGRYGERAAALARLAD